LAVPVGECQQKFAKGFSPSTKRTKFGLQQSLREATMPVYDYVCNDCQNSFELVLTLTEHEQDNISCPTCGSKNVEQDAVAFYAVTSKKS
jgi:putative FmdB family regulatory protein